MRAKKNNSTHIGIFSPSRSQATINVISADSLAIQKRTKHKHRIADMT